MEIWIILFSGFVVRIGQERLPWRVRGGELLGGTGYSGKRGGKDWMVRIEEYVTAFGMKFEGWWKAAQNAGRWFRRVEEEAGVSMQK